MEKTSPSDEQLIIISKGILDSLRRDHVFQDAGILISEMASSIVPTLGIPASFFGYENVREAFQDLQSAQERFSRVFHELLKESIEFTEFQGRRLSWEFFEASILLSEIDRQRIKIRLVLRWNTPNRVLSTGKDCARWKETK